MGIIWSGSHEWTSESLFYSNEQQHQTPPSPPSKTTCNYCCLNESIDRLTGPVPLVSKAHSTGDGQGTPFRVVSENDLDSG